MPGTPYGLGKGIFWWEPAVPLRQEIAGRGIFDQDGNALPAITAFDKYTRGRAEKSTVSGPAGTSKAGTVPAPTRPANE